MKKNNEKDVCEQEPGQWNNENNFSVIYFDKKLARKIWHVYASVWELSEDSVVQKVQNVSRSKLSLCGILTWTSFLGKLRDE